MAVEAQMYSGFTLGSLQDLMAENASGMNDPRIQTRDVEFDPHAVMGFSRIDNRSAEIDLFISSQNERLRRALLEQRRHQICSFLKSHESRVQFLIKQKDEQIAAAARRTLELQGFLVRMEAERQVWQRLARENEATAVTLSATVERMRGAAAAADTPADAGDAQSCCCAGGGGDGEEEKDKEDHETRKMVCRNCRRRNSCVIMLPCRHLSSCTDCEPFLQFCPVCNVMKKASVEAVFA